MLSDSLKVLLSSTFAYYLKSHGFHWNVTGAEFYQLHKFFQKIYEDSYDAIDPIAEYIRTLDSNPPFSFERFQELSVIQSQTKIPRANLMIEELLADTQSMINLCNEVFAAAEQENKQDIANFIAERLSSHGKYSWQLKSFLENGRT